MILGILKDETHKGLTQRILREVLPVVGKNRDRVIAQNYNGAPVMSESKSGVQTVVKEVFTNERYIHF